MSALHEITEGLSLRKDSPSVISSDFDESNSVGGNGVCRFCLWEHRLFPGPQFPEEDIGIRSSLPVPEFLDRAVDGVFFLCQVEEGDPSRLSFLVAGGPDGLVFRPGQLSGVAALPVHSPAPAPHLLPHKKFPEKRKIFPKQVEYFLKKLYSDTIKTLREGIFWLSCLLE